MLATGFLTLYLLCGVSPDVQTGVAVARVFSDVRARVIVDANGSALEEGQYILTSGWALNRPDGSKATRTELQFHSARLVALGPRAIPMLTWWLTSEDKTIRYVACNALARITGIPSSAGPFAECYPVSEQKGDIRKWMTWRPPNDHSNRPSNR